MRICMKKLESSIFHWYFMARCYVICNPMSVRDLTFRMKMLSILGCVVMGAFWPSLPLFGWSYYTLEAGLTSCTVAWADQSLNVVSYNVTIFGFAFLLPVLIILFTNLKTIQFVSAILCNFIHNFFSNI